MDVIVSPHRVTHLVPLQSGGVAFATAGPAFGVLDVRDARSLYVENPRATGTTNPGQSGKPKPTTQAAAKPQADEGQCYGVANDSKPFGSKLLYERGKWVYFDRSGKIQMSVPFRSADSFSQSRASIAHGDKAGYIDKADRLVIPPTFRFPRTPICRGTCGRSSWEQDRLHRSGRQDDHQAPVQHQP